MIVSWNWLTDYLRLDMPVDVLTERLALTGLNHRIDLRGRGRPRDRPGGHEQPVGLPGAHRRRPRDRRACSTSPCASRPRGRRAQARAVETSTAIAVEAADLCPRFTARVISGVRVGESPWWLRKRLETIGVRPISNMVDVTNYVMFECGQPLHAYDLDRLAEHRLVVRLARAGRDAHRDQQPGLRAEARDAGHRRRRPDQLAWRA